VTIDKPRLRFALLAIAFLAGSGRAAEAQSSADVDVGASVDTVLGPAVYVSDLSRSLKFYYEALGMKVTMQFAATGEPLDVGERTRLGQLSAGQPNSVLSFSNDPASPILMLLTEATSPPRKIEHGHGYARVAFRMANLPVVAQRLRSAGFAPGSIRGAHGAHQVMFVKDPDGYTVELIEGNTGG
jgi:catechol 2,3-dioxygenase-like lactoylglutathione lyase family enzyme